MVVIVGYTVIVGTSGIAVLGTKVGFGVRVYSSAPKDCVLVGFLKSLGVTFLRAGLFEQAAKNKIENKHSIVVSV